MFLFGVDILLCLQLWVFQRKLGSRLAENIQINMAEHCLKWWTFFSEECLLFLSLPHPELLNHAVARMLTMVDFVDPSHTHKYKEEKNKRKRRSTGKRVGLPVRQGLTCAYAPLRLAAVASVTVGEGNEGKQWRWSRIFGTELG